MAEAEAGLARKPARARARVCACPSSLPRLARTVNYAVRLFTLLESEMRAAGAKTPLLSVVPEGARGAGSLKTTD